ncbi:hypothetical protein MMC31_006400 [Peltigera leucophlebia]|nr:hypothetical protein [Peltigera leucophlebia]
MVDPISHSSSFDNTPSSNILTAIELLRARWQGTSWTHSNVVTLSPSQHASLWQHLESKEKELAEYHVRTNYDPTTFQFIVPIPLAVHEELSSSIQYDFFEQLSSIRNDGNNPAAGLAKIFRGGRSTTIYFDDGGHRSPDLQFIYNDVEYPSLIVEVASQTETGSSLPKLADRYIVMSDANILLVIGVEVAYRGEKKGAISTWCPEYGTDDKGDYLASQQTIVSQPFLNVDGTAVSGNLRIPLRSFTPEPICSKFPAEALDVELVLSYEKLAMCLKLAAGQEEIRRTGQASRVPLGARIRQQTRDSTPPEILSVED